jgi:ribosomal-protein-alanine N-acetyltransferase
MTSTRREAPDIQISQMTEHDLLSVVEIEETCGLSRWGWDAYHAELAPDKNSIMLIAKVRSMKSSSTTDTVIGFIAARQIADELHINNVAVKERYRRLGIAQKLMALAIDEAAKRGAQTAFLEVRAGNAPAQALYARCGFKVSGRRSYYYTQPLEDALVMTLAIRSSA